MIGRIGSDKAVSMSHAKDFLDSWGLSPDDAKELEYMNLAVKVNGYAYIHDRVGDNQMLIPVIFLSESERTDLIGQFRRIKGTGDKRTMLQNALKALAKAYIGEKYSPNTTFEEVYSAMMGIEQAIGGQVMKINYSIEDITDPSKVSDGEIDDLIDHLVKSADVLESSKCSYSRDGSTYYYIMMNEMPLQ